jgi:hypothetical protein
MRNNQQIQQMKATLSFNLPEESIEHLDALHGYEWKAIVMDLHRIARNSIKHGHSYKQADDAIQDMLNCIHCAVMDRGLTLD